MSKRATMRSAMTMIELIFAIVIIAISVLTIPSMLSVASNASKAMLIDEDILKRMIGEITKVSQARWDQNSTEPDFTPLRVAGDMLCDRNVSGIWYRRNPDSIMMCSDNNASAIPTTGDLNLSKGIEQLNNNPYNLEVNSTSGNVYTFPIEYTVSYVASTLTAGPNANGIATATWRLGSSTAMNPNPSGAKTHLKRVVTTVQSNDPAVNMTLTFFKSNVGKFSE